MRPHLCRRFTLAAVLTFSFGESAIAGPLEDGQAAYDRKEYTTALRLWRPLAEQGLARAQNNLGVMYENGRGVRQDIIEALKWYRLAAEQGYAGAQNNLALIYAIGRVVRRDPVRAYMWFSLAASSLSGELGETVTTSRDVFASAMTGQQITQATEMARRCQESHYKQCDTGDDAAAINASAPDETSTPAVARTSHAVTIEDYPKESVRRHESGEVTVTYVISETGSVATCAVVISSGNTRLDQAACFLVKRRWKYKPATQDGKPTTIQYISKVVFPAR
jgi:TonB family protein